MQMIGQLQDVIFLCDPVTLKFTYATEGALEQLGYTMDELRQMTVLDVSTAFDEATYRALIAPLLDGTLPTVNFEMTHSLPDGTVLPIDVTLQTVRDDNVVQIAVVIRDLTEHHELTSELRISEALNRAVLETALDGIILFEVDGSIRSLNSAAERMFGWKAEDIVGNSVNLLMPQLYHPDPERILRHGDEETDDPIVGISNEVEGLHRDGTNFAIRISISEIRLPGEHVFAGIIDDISEQKRVERELELKNVELKSASWIDHVSLRILRSLSGLQDDHGTHELVSILAEETGYRPLAIYIYDVHRGSLNLAAAIGLTQTQSDASFNIGEGVIGEAARRREPIVSYSPTSILFQPDGETELPVPATVFAAPLIVGDRLIGVLAGASAVRFGDREQDWISMIADQVAVGLNSQRRYWELRAISNTLNERNRRIEEQNEELQRVSTYKSQFLATMSHELRTPLNAIIGFSEALKDGLFGELDVRQSDYLGEIYESGHHLLSLINDVLDLSKVEAGKMTLDVRPVALTILLKNAMNIVQGRAFESKVGLSKQIQDDIGLVHGDEQILRRIVYNLLSNAIKFTPAGGSVELSAALVGDEVEIAVTDTGIGIAPEDIERLFVPFEQLDSGLDRRFEGTGLGLAIVKTLVELHGGTVGVLSEVGEGSRFSIRIPRYAPSLNSESMLGELTY